MFQSREKPSFLETDSYLMTHTKMYIKNRELIRRLALLEMRYFIHQWQQSFVRKVAVEKSGTDFWNPSASKKSCFKPNTSQFNSKHLAGKTGEIRRKAQPDRKEVLLSRKKSEFRKNAQIKPANFAESCFDEISDPEIVDGLLSFSNVPSSHSNFLINQQKSKQSSKYCHEPIQNKFAKSTQTPPRHSHHHRHQRSPNSSFRIHSSQNFVRETKQTQVDIFSDSYSDSISEIDCDENQTGSLISPISSKNTKSSLSSRTVQNSIPTVLNDDELDEFGLHEFNSSLQTQYERGDLFVPVLKTYQKELSKSQLSGSQLSPVASNQTSKQFRSPIRSPEKAFDFEKYRNDVLMSFSASQAPENTPLHEKTTQPDKASKIPSGTSKHTEKSKRQKIQPSAKAEVQGQKEFQTESEHLNQAKRQNTEMKSDEFDYQKYLKSFSNDFDDQEQNMTDTDILEDQPRTPETSENSEIQFEFGGTEEEEEEKEEPFNFEDYKRSFVLEEEKNNSMVQEEEEFLPEGTVHK